VEEGKSTPLTDGLADACEPVFDPRRKFRLFHHQHDARASQAIRPRFKPVLAWLEERWSADEAKIALDLESDLRSFESWLLALAQGFGDALITRDAATFASHAATESAIRRQTGLSSLADLVATDPRLGAEGAALLAPGASVARRTTPGAGGPVIPRGGPIRRGGRGSEFWLRWSLERNFTRRRTFGTQ